MTDRIADNGKKYQLLVVGEMPAPPSGSVSLSPEKIADPFPINLNDFYIVLALSDERLENAIVSLESQGVSPAQILVYRRLDAPFRHPQELLFGFLDQIEGEGAEELRARLLARLEAQRQKKLLVVLQEIQESGAAYRLEEAELQRLLDVLRVAHSLCCGYDLAPAAHFRVLRACAGSRQEHAWSGDPSPESLLPEAAALVADTLLRGGSVREALRERAVGLSFRARSDLQHQVESCLSTLLGGRNAA